MLFDCCVFSQILFLKTVIVHPSNKKEWLIVLKIISISFTIMIARLAVRSCFPLLLSAQHFPIPCHPFTVEINCYVLDRLIVTFRTRFLVRPLLSPHSFGTSTITREGLPSRSRTHQPQALCRQATGKSQRCPPPLTRV